MPPQIVAGTQGRCLMYSAGNANLTAYGHGPRLWLLALCGKMLGIQFHVQGLPFGSAHRPTDWDAGSQFASGGGNTDMLALRGLEPGETLTIAEGPSAGFVLGSGIKGNVTMAGEILPAPAKS